MDNRVPSDTYLSSTVTVADYRAFTRAKDKEQIANFIYQRLQERYLKPFRFSESEDGLAMMACGCLMAETMQAFWTGSAKSGLSGPHFLNFFERVNQFSSLREHSRLFYKHIRCGIMHHGEVTGGWLIRTRTPQLFDPENLVVDATRFLNALEDSLREYCDLLKESDWQSEVWSRLQMKMRFVCMSTLAESEYVEQPITAE